MCFGPLLSCSFLKVSGAKKRQTGSVSSAGPRSHLQCRDPLRQPRNYCLVHGGFMGLSTAAKMSCGSQLLPRFKDYGGLIVHDGY